MRQWSVQEQLSATIKPTETARSRMGAVHVLDAFTKTGLCLCLCEVVARLLHMACLMRRGQGCRHRKLQAGNQREPGQYGRWIVYTSMGNRCSRGQLLEAVCRMGKLGAAGSGQR